MKTVLPLGKDPPAITSLCFNHNGKILAASATDGMIHMFGILLTMLGPGIVVYIVMVNICCCTYLFKNSFSAEVALLNAILEVYFVPWLEQYRCHLGKRKGFQLCTAEGAYTDTAI